jgi:uncharacterized protein
MNSTFKRVFKWSAVVVPILLVGFFSFGLWSASNQLLSPSWRGVEKDLAICEPETAKYFGEGCGNLRETHQFVFSEVKIPLRDGVDLPGWLIKTTENGLEPARGAILLVHAGGSDRREETRYIPYYLHQGLDVLTFDLECHGEAPCPVYGLSYGERESKNVLAAYSYLQNTYETIYIFGTSVGAASVLIALPDMPDAAGVIAENPIYNFEQLVKEAPQSQSIPGWFTDLLLNFSMWRGKFNGRSSPVTALPLAQAQVPILFIHCKEDEVVSPQHTQELADLYSGPKTVWVPDKGSHATIWDVNKPEYERRVAEFLNSNQ